jgi:hypothetical protein
MARRAVSEQSWALLLTVAANSSKFGDFKRCSGACYPLIYQTLRLM